MHDNPYLEDEDDAPAPVRKPVPWVAIAVMLGVLGCFLPAQKGCEFSSPIPIPIPIDDEVDPAKTEGSWVVVVEQVEARTPAQAQVMAGKVWQGLAARGLKFRHYDADASDAQQYLPMVGNLPGVLIIGPDGLLLKKLPLPATVEELDAAIKEATGR